jgi:hypothetical protein
MVRAELNDLLNWTSSSPRFDQAGASPDAESFAQRGERFGERSGRPRLTPRKSLVVVLADNHVVSPELVAERLTSTGDHDAVDVIVACAGQPVDLGALQRKVHDLQVLLAPSGTSVEKLRELAIMQAPGDIVTLLSGAPWQSVDA